MRTSELNEKNGPDRDGKSEREKEYDPNHFFVRPHQPRAWKRQRQFSCLFSLKLLFGVYLIQPNLFSRLFRRGKGGPWQGAYIHGKKEIIPSLRGLLLDCFSSSRFFKSSAFWVLSLKSSSASFKRKFLST